MYTPTNLKINIMSFTLATAQRYHLEKRYHLAKLPC